MRRLACAAYGDPTSGCFTTEAGARTRTDALSSMSTGVYRRTATSRRCTQYTYWPTTHTLPVSLQTDACRPTGSARAGSGTGAHDQPRCAAHRPHEA
eukprot:scaffold144849_cov175-Phaeocystis_antarctica.AAC.1